MPGSLPSTDGGPVILLVNKADGDEEVFNLTFNLSVSPNISTKDYIVTGKCC